MRAVVNSVLAGGLAVERLRVRKMGPYSAAVPAPVVKVSAHCSFETRWNRWTYRHTISAVRYSAASRSSYRQQSVRL